VLVPLNDIAPDWRDPMSGSSVKELLADLLSREDKIPFRTITGEEP
jgi:2-amino-4-hydroxy-6-hydroxymethyldihydropteridine diphosphokinase